jgi:hypothetical protein
MPLSQSIGLDTLSKYFHLPINDVAKELGVCATVLKKICRKNGIPRWPHRKIKSLDKMITTLEASVAKNPEDEERIRQEIQTLKNKKMFLMKNPNVLATKPNNIKKSTKPQQTKRSTNNSNNNSSNNNNASANNGSNSACAPRPFNEPPHMGPSTVLNPMAAALYSQIPHPHIPQPVPISSSIISSSPPPEKQWVPGEHRSAFVPTKALRARQQQQQSPPPSSYAVPQYNQGTVQKPDSNSTPNTNEEVRAVPQPALEFPIHLPELRISDDGDKPKLTTLEPELFPVPKSASSPKKETLPPNSKWQLPEWFADEHKQVMKKVDQQGEYMRQPEGNEDVKSNQQSHDVPITKVDQLISDVQVPSNEAPSSSLDRASPMSLSTEDL